MISYSGRTPLFLLSIYAVALLTVSTAHAQQGAGSAATPGAPAATGPGPIMPNRPGFTNGSATVAPGDALAENGFAITRATAANGGTETLDLPQTNLRVGVTPNLEADVVLPDYYSVHGGDQGFGDGAVGVKYKFYQSRNGNTKASVSPSLSLPTHTEFSSGGYDPTLLLGVQTASGSRWNVSSNLVLANPTDDQRRIFTTTVSGSVSYTLTTPLSVYVDAFDILPHQGAPSPSADGGFAYLVNNNVQLDTELYVGLGGDAPVHVLEGGVSFRL